MSGIKSSDLTTIKIGTRVRHTADGAMGRIVWANAVSAKIQWDDGEKVTWKRAELGSKGLEVVEDDDTTQPQDMDDRRPVEPARAESEANATTAGDAQRLPDAAAMVAVEPPASRIETLGPAATQEITGQPPKPAA